MHQAINNLFKLKLLLIWFFLIIPIFHPLRSILTESIPHWFDTAWGMLLGLENLQKLRLVGYGGGIPGILYGPYWMWMMSSVQIFNKNPAVITFVTIFLPFVIIFPYFLYKFSTIFGKSAVALMWLFFILLYYPNASHPWHIHLAPIIFLALIYFLITTKWQNCGRVDFFKSIVSGFLTGILINIHMSFGTAITLGIIGFQTLGLMINSWQQKHDLKKVIKTSLLIYLFFMTGLLICFIPFIIFELRHDFLQIRGAFYVVTQSLLYNSAVVGQVGMKKWDIVNTVILMPSKLLQLPDQLGYSFWLAAFYIISVLIFQKKWKLTDFEKKMLSLSAICITFLLIVYLSTRNPVWIYHFLGLEVIFLLFIGFLLHKSKLLKIILTVWVGYLSLVNVYKIITDKPVDPLSLETLYAKKYVVESIYKDAGDEKFTVFAYSPAIYTFDYDYLFKWLGNDRYHFEPEIKPIENLVYLIIPKTSEGIFTDFIHYKTPDSKFETSNRWQIANGTTVIKRIKKY